MTQEERDIQTVCLKPEEYEVERSPDNSFVIVCCQKYSVDACADSIDDALKLIYGIVAERFTKLADGLTVLVPRSQC